MNNDTITHLIASVLNTMTRSDGEPLTVGGHMARLESEVDTDGRIVVDVTEYDFTGVVTDMKRVVLFPSPAVPVASDLSPEPELEQTPVGVGEMDQQQEGAA